MKTKLKNSVVIEWERVFKIFPVNTEDGYRVVFGHVWRHSRETVMGRIEYDFHTNPDGLEDEYQRNHSDGFLGVGMVPPPPPRPSPPKPQTTLLERFGMTEEINDWVYKQQHQQPLTEGKMKCGAKMPTCKRPKKPPPPAAPPPKFRGEVMNSPLTIEPKEKEIQIGDKFKRTYKQTKRKL